MPLSQFEDLAKRLVEGSFHRLFGGVMEPLEIATQLAHAMEDNQQNGRCPNYFAVYLHPNDHALLQEKNPQLSEELVAYVQRLAQQGSLLFASKPTIELKPNADIGRHHLQIETQHQPVAATGDTQVYQRETAVDELAAALKRLDAVLIVAGRRQVPLTQPMISLGRQVGNDVRLESPNVSRRHAQIRWRYGRFILYDLSGRGRTAVNGKPISEHALQPGDIITLSDTTIIYAEGGQNNPPAPLSENTPSTLVLPSLPSLPDSEPS